MAAVNVASNNVEHSLAARLLLAGMLLWTVVSTVAYSPGLCGSGRCCW